MNTKLIFLPLMAMCLTGCAINAGGTGGDNTSKSESATSESGTSSQSQGGGESTGSELVLEFTSANRTAGTNSFTWAKDGFKVTNNKGSYADDFTASAKDDHARFYAATSLTIESSKPIKQMVFQCWLWSEKNGADNLAAETWSVGSASAGSAYAKGDYQRADCTWSYAAGATTISIAKLNKQTRVDQVKVIF